ncbi:hypothetical protein AVEN_236126-1 [Araneus ventricosus]|uniref:Peptidase aspartic putative domain-containing protein n=1 Tax=Araneus ventricosus TaxID=182803 RepID=A0A4Y2G0F4_ARAVE|nr:hypothetical protein AVEN_236126-1 [Araneus ventricosus]
MKVEERLNAIQGICCENCLRKNHTTANYRINIGCKACKDRHHALLHLYKVNIPASNESNRNDMAVSSGIQLHTSRQSSSVLLSTAIIKVKSRWGKLIECKALVANASQLSLISQNLAEKLNLPLKNGLPVKGPSATPIAIPTQLGYILPGKIYTNKVPEAVIHSTLCDNLTKFRTLEEVHQTSQSTSGSGFPETFSHSKSIVGWVNTQWADDLLAGADSEEEAQSLIIEFQNLMKSGAFLLRKWSSSHESILQELDRSLVASKSIHSLGDEESKQRVLGMFWNLLSDSIQIRVVNAEIVNTKRKLLSIIAKTFDPLGLFSPSTIILKMMLQDLWKSKASWDDPVPPTIRDTWSKFRLEISHLNAISIPRFLGVDKESSIQLHGFCDASTKAFAAVVYIKNVLNNKVSIRKCQNSSCSY